MLMLAMLLPTAITAVALPDEGSLEEQKIISTADDKNQQSFYYAARFKEKYTTVVVTRTTQKARIEYPANFGGIYIDDNNDLHILCVDDSKEFRKNMAEDEIIYDRVKYSYNDLLKIYETLSEKMIEFSITEVVVDEFNNRVTVAAEEASRDAILQYLSASIAQFDAGCIVFKAPVQCEFTDVGGAGIKTGGIVFTLGYNAKNTITGKYGFVTCAHPFNGVGELVRRYNSSETELGYVKTKKLGGKIDAAYIEYINQSNKTPYCRAGGNLNGTLSSTQITAGMSVRKYGNATKLQTGKVLSANVSAKVGEYTVTDQVLLDIVQESGDSGAPVTYDFIGPMPDGSKPLYLIGIATMKGKEIQNTAFVSKAENINYAFNLNTYIVV